MTRATSSAGKGAARAGDSADAPRRRDIRLLENLRSIASISAALRNTG